MNKTEVFALIFMSLPVLFMGAAYWRDVNRNGKTIMKKGKVSWGRRCFDLIWNGVIWV